MPGLVDTKTIVSIPKAYKMNYFNDRNVSFYQQFLLDIAKCTRIILIDEGMTLPLQIKFNVFIICRYSFFFISIVYLDHNTNTQTSALQKVDAYQYS